MASDAAAAQTCQHLMYPCELRTRLAVRLRTRVAWACACTHTSRRICVRAYESGTAKISICAGSSRDRCRPTASRRKAHSLRLAAVHTTRNDMTREMRACKEDSRVARAKWAYDTVVPWSQHSVGVDLFHVGVRPLLLPETTQASEHRACRQRKSSPALGVVRVSGSPTISETLATTVWQR